MRITVLVSYYKSLVLFIDILRYSNNNNYNFCNNQYSYIL